MDDIVKWDVFGRFGIRPRDKNEERLIVALLHTASQNVLRSLLRVSWVTRNKTNGVEKP